MISRIATEAEATAHCTSRPHFDERVMSALASIPRQEFIPASEEGRAYINAALSIGYGQTISQPYIVALMTDLLSLPPTGAVVLEIGTGSGYQTAVLAQLAAQVYSIEIIPALATQARARLMRLGYDNVEVRLGDGYLGCAEHAPYDGVLVTAAVTEIPPPLIAQLRVGGRMVVPVGRSFTSQDLTVLEKRHAGQPKTQSMLPVAFVPFKRESGNEGQQ
jgi:protein-L-isoaspartate(D-aspartate) O-methyltransferase